MRHNNLSSNKVKPRSRHLSSSSQLGGCVVGLRSQPLLPWNTQPNQPGQRFPSSYSMNLNEVVQLLRTRHSPFLSLCLWILCCLCLLTDAVSQQLKSVRSEKDLWVSVHVVHQQRETKGLGRFHSPIKMNVEEKVPQNHVIMYETVAQRVSGFLSER